MEEPPLPGLLPDDPENRLSTSARQRVMRAKLESERIRWEVEANAEARHLSEEKKTYLRNQADLKGARTVLKVLSAEYDAAGLTLQEYWSAIREEIASAANSLSLNTFQRRMLEVEFHLPPDRKPAPRESRSAHPSPVKAAETVGAQIQRLRVQCELTEEDLAEAVEMDIRSVQRHLASETVPRALSLRRYEKTFSKLLNQQIVIR